MGEERGTTSSHPVPVSSGGTPTPSDSNPGSDSDGVSASVGDKMTESEREEYEGVIALCSMWWSLHPESTSDPNPESEPPAHPWGHPRTWTPSQCREVFLKARQYDNVNSPHPEPEDDPDTGVDLDATKKEEARLLRDEGHMLELVRMHGFESMYELLFWLPVSRNWHQNGRLKSLAQLKSEQNWNYISADMRRYYDKARENNNEESCDEYVERVYLEAGGDAAESICWERLNPPPPIDPRDAAEEEAMYAFDDEFGVDVINPWAAEDYAAAAAAKLGGKTARDPFLDPWGDADDSDHAVDTGAPHANDTDEAGDDEPEPPPHRFCENCGSAHAGMCVPDVDLE